MIHYVKLQLPQQYFSFLLNFTLMLGGVGCKVRGQRQRDGEMNATEIHNVKSTKKQSKKLNKKILNASDLTYAFY